MVILNLFSRRIQPMHKNVQKMKALLLASGLLTSAIVLSACQPIRELGVGQVINEGYVPDKYDLMSVKIGSSQKQVLLAMGSPTIKTIYQNDVFYYISQKRYRKAAFMTAKIVDRKIFSIYFDKNHRVIKLANYGLKDGRVFDFASNETPSVHQEDNGFLNKIMSVTRIAPYGIPTNKH